LLLGIGLQRRRASGPRTEQPALLPPGTVHSATTSRGLASSYRPRKRRRSPARSCSIGPVCHRWWKSEPWRLVRERIARRSRVVRIHWIDLHGFCNLFPDGQCFLDRNASALQTVLQRPTLHQLHDNATRGAWSGSQPWQTPVRCLRSKRPASYRSAYASLESLVSPVCVPAIARSLRANGLLQFVS
jgi:hypothetical protein